MRQKNVSFSEVKTFARICDLHKIKPEGNPYSLYLGSYIAIWMQMFDTSGWIKITDITERVDGTRIDFTLTELGEQMLEFDKL